MPRLLLIFALFLSTRIVRADETLPVPEVALPAPVIETRSTRVVAPGIELTTIHRSTPNALDASNSPLQLFITKVDPKAGGENLKWKLKLATAGDTVFKFAPVSEIAKREKAIVGINGGYFAFGGAALGAVKIDNEWIRLPMKNRTAVGFGDKGEVVIDNNSARANVYFGGSITNDDPTYVSLHVAVDNLNGYAPENGASVLTPRFGSNYKLRSDEIAVEAEGDMAITKVVTGIAFIRPKGWTLIVRGTARDSLRDFDKSNVRYAQFSAGVSDKWQKYPTILGAGPRLLKNGEIFTTEKEEEFRPDVLARGPRSAFGVDAKGNWIFLVCDGREKEYSAGLSISELALEMKNAGAVDALCLDGGGSSTLVVNNELINRPSDGIERKVPNSILVVPVEN